LYSQTKQSHKLIAKPDFEFPKTESESHKKAPIAMQISNDHKFMATSSPDTVVKVWNLATGALLGEFNTNQMLNKMLCISPDSRFIVVACFTSDVKVWEVAYKKTGEFDSIRKAMDLSGHRSGINSVCFSPDSTRVITGGKEGWRVYRINVRYHLGEDPVLEKTVATEIPISKMELTPDGKTLAIIDKKQVQFWDVATAKLVYQLNFNKILPNSGSGEITSFAWAEEGKLFITTIADILYIWKSPIKS